MQDWFWTIGLLSWITDAVAGSIVVALLCCLALVLDSPYQAFVLLRDNRPARGTGWKMWQADRYVQLWLSSRPKPSTNQPFDIRMPTGMGGTTIDRPTPTRRIDEMLARRALVTLNPDTAHARRSFYLFVRNWLVYLICKWYLIYFAGDTRQWWKEIATN